MQEQWKTIEDFPDYLVSDHGRVANQKTGRILSLTRNQKGVLKVGLIAGRGQQQRAVRLLVAEAFVEGRSDIFDTPIQLDGNRDNARADNLMWRPRWFSYKYAHQFTVSDPAYHNRPVRDVKTKESYSSIFEASIRHGILAEDIWKSTLYNKSVQPTNQIFEFC